MNNAGIVGAGLIEWQTVEEMKHVLDVNLWGMVSVTKALLPQLKKTKGCIVNVASAWGTIIFGPLCNSILHIKAWCSSIL